MIVLWILVAVVFHACLALAMLWPPAHAAMCSTPRQTPQWLIHAEAEARPFMPIAYVLPIVLGALAFAAEGEPPHVPFLLTAVVFGLLLRYWWRHRKCHGGGRWRRRLRKLGERVHAFGGRLTVVPAPTR